MPANGFQSVEQTGFRKGYCTIDHLQTINQIMEKARGYQQTIYIAMVDFNKLFDSVEHAWNGLKVVGIKYKYMRITMEIHKNSTASTKLEDCGPVFKLFTRIRQVNPLPSLLFNIAQRIFQ